MRKIATVIVAIIAIMMMACSSQSKQDAAQSEPASKCLVLYYSQTGATKAVAEEIANALGADIEAIELENPYPESYDATIQRCIGERQRGEIPAIKPVKADLGNYEVVFLGYPIWFGTYAPPVAALLAQQDFAGKKVVPFCTFGSGGLEASARDLTEALPKAEIAEGYGVRNARVDAAPAEVSRFLIEGGYVEGEIDPLPEFSEQQPVTDAEKAIFDAACSSYQFPLGTPVTFAMRQLPDAVEYCFMAESPAPDGTTATTPIYVLAPAEGEAVFTRVVR